MRKGVRISRIRVGPTTSPATRTRTTPRTGARRAARLRRTLDERPKSMSVEFEDLGPFENSKEARDRRADSRRLRLDHPDLYTQADE